MINIHTVKSSGIASIGYDDVEEALFVEFHSGKVWRYHQVPQVEYINLLNAPIIGRFFSKKIRDKYNGAEVDAMPAATPKTPPINYNWAAAGPVLVWG